MPSTNNVFEWTAEERANASKVLSGDARALNSGRPSTENPIPECLCAQWRQHIHDGGRPQSVDARGFTRTAIRKHVRGDCSHEHGVPAAEYRGGEWVCRDH